MIQSAHAQAKPFARPATAAADFLGAGAADAAAAVGAIPVAADEDAAAPAADVAVVSVAMAVPVAHVEGSEGDGVAGLRGRELDSVATSAAENAFRAAAGADAPETVEGLTASNKAHHLSYKLVILAPNLTEELP